MKKYIQFFLVIIILGILAIASYFYFTRPIKITDSTPILNEEKKEITENAFYIVKEESSVEYNIGEKLYGKPTLVVGKNNEITGNFVLDIEDSKNIKSGKIIIDARTFKTDQERRDSTVVRFILRSEEKGKEFIEFDNIQIKNTLQKFEIGKTYNLEILGDLTISGITKPISFEAEINLKDENTMAIQAETKIFHKDFGLTIPEFPFLADIDNQVILKISLIAKKQ